MPIWLITALPMLVDAGKAIFQLINDAASDDSMTQEEFEARVGAMKAKLQSVSDARKAMRAGTGPGGRG